MGYWLLKSEPSVYGVGDLQRDNVTLWDGVRNYQARNFLQAMQLGDLAFFYHSNVPCPGIVGLMRVIETLVVDPTQFDSSSDYFDPRSTLEKPRWLTVRLEFVELFPNLVSLETLKQNFTADELLVVKKGNRLSVIPVGENVAKKILDMVLDSHDK